MKRKINWMRIGKTMGIGLTLLVFLFGCKQFNDDPAENNGKFTLNIGSIKRQLGYRTSSSEATTSPAESMYRPGDTNATEQVKALILGAMVVAKRDTPYSTDEAITDKVGDDISADIQKSILFLKVVHLEEDPKYPNLYLGDEDSIVFDIPLGDTDKWQIVAVGFRTKPVIPMDATEKEHEDGPIYYGFSDDFIDSKTAEETTINLRVKRACWVDVPPKGCAAYSDVLEEDPFVTTGVEIVGVKINGVAQSKDDSTTDTFSFPIYVRDETDVNTAKRNLKALRNAFQYRNSTKISSTTVRTTHAYNPIMETEKPTCWVYREKGSATSADQLINACGEQIYKIYYE
ncbi:MAG: hypothetical protein GY866_37455 [Proteobacteria bacterium]|nr:hypothetical protein [Pseudomonadota bacterium]